jgi:hypothetical protein
MSVFIHIVHRSDQWGQKWFTIHHLSWVSGCSTGLHEVPQHESDFWYFIKVCSCRWWRSLNHVFDSFWLYNFRWMIHFIMVISDIQGNVDDCCRIKFRGKESGRGGRLSHRGVSNRDLYDTLINKDLKFFSLWRNTANIDVYLLV